MDLLAQQFEGLSEDTPAKAIGDIIGLDDSRLIPFLCGGHRFLASYTSIRSQEESLAASMQGIVRQDAKHKMSDHAQILKFAHYDLFFGSQKFSPAPVAVADRRPMLFCIPPRIAGATLKLMEFDQNADEFYFIAGGESEQRIDQLDLWYRRLSDRFPFHTLGLTHIHQSKGSWYGYRKIRR